MNTTLVTYKGKCDCQGTFLKTKKRATAQLSDDAETARARLQIDRTRCANQIGEILSSHLKCTWVVERRGGLGGKRDLSLSLVNLVTRMLMNPTPMNKKGAWRSVNRASNNQESHYLFETAVKHEIMTTKTAERGIVTYELHPNILDQLRLEPQQHRFKKMQYWHLTRENVLLRTVPEREAEHQKRMSALASSATRKKDENA